MIREPILQFFEYQHLHAHLQDHSKAFWALAHHVCNTIKESPERTVALRKLLEAKDAAVRAAVFDITKGEVKEVVREQDQRPVVRDVA
jgi:carbonic anhydrase